MKFSGTLWLCICHSLIHTCVLSLSPDIPLVTVELVLKVEVYSHDKDSFLPLLVHLPPVPMSPPHRFVPLKVYFWQIKKITYVVR